MFANRTNWNLDANRLSQALARHLAAGLPLYDLTASNPTGCGFAYDAKAILGVTRSGLTAEMLSRERARVPIYAFTPDEGVARRLALWWGITPVQCQLPNELEATIESMERHLIEHEFVMPSDTVVITGSHPFGVGLHTNFVKFHVLGQG